MLITTTTAGCRNVTCFFLGHKVVQSHEAGTNQYVECKRCTMRRVIAPDVGSSPIDWDWLKEYR
jgi:hypothetical protein